MAKQVKPTIELYMFSLHQEFPEGVSHASFVDRKQERISSPEGVEYARDKLSDRLVGPQVGRGDDWPAAWLHAKWLTDHTKAITARFERPDVSPISLAMTREEDFGGIIYDPFSDRVYKANPSGLALFRSLQKTAKAGKSLGEFLDNRFKQSDLAEFAAFLKGAGLWDTQ